MQRTKKMQILQALLLDILIFVIWSKILRKGNSTGGISVQFFISEINGDIL